MAKITIKQLEALVQVADLGSFRRAAEKLNTTQPNISARISGIEAQVGAKLMDRDAGSVRLTPIGAALLPKARQAVDAIDEFLISAGNDTLFEGVLRLGVTEMIVHSWLGKFISAFKNRFPNIDVDLTVDLSASLSDALFNRSIDLALQSGPFGRSISGSVALGSFPLIWIAAPTLGIGDKVLSLTDLAAHPILTHARGTLPFDKLQEHVAASSDTSVRLVPSTNMAACIEMTVQGLGVACLPEVMVRDQIAAGDLSQLRYLWCPDDLKFWARFDETAPYFVVEAARLAGEVSRGDLFKG